MPDVSEQMLVGLITLPTIISLNLMCLISWQCVSGLPFSKVLIPSSKGTRGHHPPHCRQIYCHSRTFPVAILYWVTFFFFILKDFVYLMVSFFLEILKFLDVWVGFDHMSWKLAAAPKLYSKLARRVTLKRPACTAFEALPHNLPCKDSLVFCMNPFRHF